MKLWYQSWTVWANLLGGLVLALQVVTSTNYLVLEPEVQALLLAVLNLLLRFKTNTAVALR